MDVRKIMDVRTNMDVRILYALAYGPIARWVFSASAIGHHR